jgi:hypothetical protein
MKKILLAALTALAFLACQTKKDEHHEHDATSTETAAPDTIKKSIPKEEHAMIGTAHFTILYHAPAVRGRTIWGGLVPYDEVWVTGAHRATSMEVNKDVLMAGQKIAAGKYALFTIPGKDSWTVIINKKWDQHLADEYDPKEDVTRFTITPKLLADTKERLEYAIESESDSKGTLTISWEKISLIIPLEVN